MNKIQSLAVTVALLFNVGCTTSLDSYRKETGYEKPHTVEGYHHFAGWCKKTGRIEDQIWAHQEAVRKLPNGSEAEITERIELGQSYLTLLKDFQLNISTNRYSSDVKDTWIKARNKCVEAKENSNLIPPKEIRFYGTREEIDYLCDKFNHQKTFRDFQTF
ncbi:hypothetical protein HQ489_00195 [Candidatus Woesearchaeota archaeon]|nr:hypothetical protein [Candidatus Woesearchaeota archaeon]